MAFVYKAPRKFDYFKQSSLDERYDLGPTTYAPENNKKISPQK